MHFGIFPCHLSKDSKVHAPATKKWPQVTRSAAPVTQNHLSKPEDLMLQSAAPQEISARTSQHVWPRCLVRLLGEMDLCRSSWNIPRRPSFLQLLQNPHVYLSHEKRCFNLQKWSERGVVFTILISACASHHSDVLLFNISFPKVLRTRGAFSFLTSKSVRGTAAWTPQEVLGAGGVFNILISKCNFLPFRALYSSFFWLFLFSDLLSYAFLFSDSSHLCCFICPYCRKFGF